MKRINDVNTAIPIAMTTCCLLILQVSHGHAESLSPFMVRPVVMIPPATVVGDRPPAAWSHLIVKSHTRVGSGDIRKVPARDVRMASRFATVMLANVTQTNPNQFELQEIGVGCTTTIKGQDVVISPVSHKQLGANLGFFEGILLKEMCKRQTEIMLVGYQPTIGIIDVSAAVRWQDNNQMMTLRYALIVDSSTGKLDAFVWLVDPDAAAEQSVVSNIEWLATNCVEKCILHVDAAEYRFGTVPSETAYAALSIPRGQQQLRVTESAKPLLGRKQFSIVDVIQVEQALRSLQNERTARISKQQR